MAGIIRQHKEDKARKKEKNDPTASKGFQYTPAFIHAVIQDAVKEVRTSLAAGASDAATGVATATEPPKQFEAFTLPRGGTTDVGQHTGGIPRDTSWPLVKQTLLVGCWCLLKR